MPSYTVGDFVVMKQRHYEIQSITSRNKVKLKDTLTGAQLEYLSRELDDAIFLGNAELLSSDSKYNELHANSAKDFHSYSKEDKQIARGRALYVKAFQQSEIRGISNKKEIDDLISSVAEDNKLKLISWRTLKRWVDDYESYGIRGLIPQTKKKGNRKSRKPAKLESLIIGALDIYQSNTRPKFNTAHEYLEDQVRIHNDKVNKGLLDEDLLPSLSYQAFINRAKKIAPASLLEAYVGKSAAYGKNRVSRKPDSAEYILERAEIDHTTGDCFVVDDVNSLPLGRPNVTAVLDKRSSAVLGAYIGFEAASYVSVARAIKHAISDKSQFLSNFPSKEEWPCRGAFMEIAYDRGKEFDSDLLQDTLDDLGIVGRGNPAGMPWYKGAVESFFSTLNSQLLDNVPGKVFASLFDSNEYDPLKNAIIPLSDFLEAFYTWLVDVYMRTPHGKDKIVPYAVWKLEEPYVDIEPISPKKLELAFSENLTRINQDKGIVWDYIEYDNDFLLALRKSFGNQKLKVKLNREDLSLIHVLNPTDERYYPVEAKNQEYTRGLTLYQHKVCRRYKKHLDKESVDEVSLAYARQRVRDIISKAVSSGKKRKSAHVKAAARVLDLGQDKIGNNTLENNENVKDHPPLQPSVPKGSTTPGESNSEFLKKFNQGKV